MKKATICLNMIVKNEAHVIRRCLGSLKHLINYWVIVDTGSTDDTKKVIKEFMKDIPGELHERSWVNFGHNRNEALDLARKKAEYILFIDADDQLVFSDNFVMPRLDKDFYYVVQHLNHMDKKNHPNNLVVLLIKDLPDFKWMGVLHEVLSCCEGRTFETMEGVINEYLHDGHRSQDPERFDNDVQMFKMAIEKDPKNSRNYFYLGQTYRGGTTPEHYRLAIHYYEKRAAMGEREDEVFYSLYCMGLMERKLGSSPETIIERLCKAHLNRPSRVEPLFELIGYLIENGNYYLAYILTKYAVSVPLTIDLFVEPWVYEWGVKLQWYYCSRQLKKYRDAYKAIQGLLSNEKFPPDQRSQIEPDLPVLERIYASRFT